MKVVGPLQPSGSALLFSSNRLWYKSTFRVRAGVRAQAAIGESERESVPSRLLKDPMPQRSSASGLLGSAEPGDLFGNAA